MKSPLLFVALALCLTASSPCQTKKRIAVFPFVDRTTSNKEMNIGVKVADALVSKLAESGSFAVIDRDNLQRIMTERNMKFDENFNPVGAPQSGLMDVVDIIVTGQVSEFSANKKSVKKGNYVSQRTEVHGETSLKVTSRLVAVQTGQVLAAPYSSAEETSLLASSVSTPFAQNVGSQTDLSSADSALAKLVDKAVDETTDSLSKKISSGPAATLVTAPVVASAPPPPPGPARMIKAKFVGIDEGAVVINKGSAAGVKVGDKFSLIRVVTTKMKDPDTGKFILRHKQVCDLVIVSVEDTVATGKCAGDSPAPGDEANLVVP